MQRCACGLYRVRSTRRSGRDRPPAWRARPDVTGYNGNTARPRADRRLAPGPPALGGRSDLYRVALSTLDTTIANIALPAIATDLHVSAADVIWVVNIYQIAMVATLLPLGALGEIVGHQRVYLGGLLLFTLASLGCALAPGRAQPDGGARASGVGCQRHHERQRRAGPIRLPDPMLGRGFGHNALVVGTAFTFGPTIASGDPFGWNMAVAVRDQYAVRR